MFKKFFVFCSIIPASIAFVYAVPEVNCGNLPGCNDDGNVTETQTFDIIWSVIETGIQYTAVIAVIAIMIGGMLYLISSGDEEKTKRAKNIIIWALVGVFISMSAYSLIALINNFRI